MVGTLLPNNLLHLALVHALTRLGAVMVPLNARLTAAEAEWQLCHAAVELLICVPETEALATAAAPEGCAVCHLRLDSPERFVGAAIAGAFSGSPLKQRLKPSRQTRSFDLDRLQAIVFTSGTTGYPKGAMLTFANHFWSATASAFHNGINPNDRWLSCLSLCHVGGLSVVFRSCLYGSAVILHDGFNVTAVLRSLEKDKATLISLVPTMLYRLLEAGMGKNNLRLALLGGAAAHPGLVQRALGADVPVAPTYGLTEAASQVATMQPEETVCKPGSVGKPLLFTTVSIWGDEGPLPAGSPGEIVVNGPTVMSGYVNDVEATGRVLRPEGLRTGDSGYLDEDGDLWLLDRRADLIVSGGENVYPAEVEHVLLQHPGVAAVCVAGIPHPEWGQQVAAVVVPRVKGRLEAADLLAFGRSHLAGYKQPRRIMFADKLPLTGSGKIQRREVARLLMNEQ
jgi:O-succinylbenzoic acid--CoA ligase